MAVEIERKFMVKGEFRHLAVKETHILQRYIVIGPDKTIRVRVAGEKAFLTIKGAPEANSFSRKEWEFSIPLKDAEEMIGICLPGKIEKTRFMVPSGNHLFEVDVFHDKNVGLVIAEIELSSEDEPFEKPEWLGKEVTGQPEYYNVNLVR